MFHIPFQLTVVAANSAKAYATGNRVKTSVGIVIVFAAVFTSLPMRLSICDDLLWSGREMVDEAESLPAARHARRQRTRRLPAPGGDRRAAEGRRVPRFDSHPTERPTTFG
jgi:hypothetical protein